MKELSEESRYQLNQLLEDVNRTFVEAVGRKTGKMPAEINGILNSAPSLMALSGYEQGLIDSLLQPDGVESLIKKRIGLGETGKLNTITNSRYARVTPGSAGLTSRSSGNKIAVIYANGPITFEIGSDLPWSDRQYITAPQLEEQLNQIRDDEDVKALVVRINSPGGSASTSDLIWHKIRDISNRMPVIASMGPVAASGGYYIAMAADSIVAESTTITGSIGVFATKFNTRQLWNEKLGITFDEVKSHEYADWLNPTRGFTETERKAYQQFVDRFYDTFISKVATSRGLSREQVDRVAQGRVWTGEDARQENLVDVLGGMDEAVKIAAETAGVSDYEIDTYPKPKDLFQLFMGSAQARIKGLLGEAFYPYDGQTKTFNPLFRYGKGDPLLILPYEIEIH